MGEQDATGEPHPFPVAGNRFPRFRKTTEPLDRRRYPSSASRTTRAISASVNGLNTNA